MDNSGKLFFFLLFVVKDCGLTSSDLHLASICKNLNLFGLAVMIYEYMIYVMNMLHIFAKVFHAVYAAFV